MFDVGFWELILIGVIALLVVGPERLPAMARNVGLWVGRIRRYVSHVKEDIEREIRAEELREMMQESTQLESLDEELKETRDTLKAVEQEIEEADASLKPDSAPADNAPESAAEKAASDLGQSLTSESSNTPRDNDRSAEVSRDHGEEKDERRSG